MNKNDEQFEIGPKLAVLMDEAFSPIQAPAGLVDRIVAKTTDPADADVEAALNEALRQPQTPGYLSGQIVERTLPHFEKQPVVLAKIVPSWLKIAAAFALTGLLTAVFIGTVVNFDLPGGDGTAVAVDPPVVDPAADLAAADALLEMQLAASLVAIEDETIETETIDQRIGLLAMQVDLAQLDFVAGDSLDDSYEDLLDRAVTSYELDAFVSQSDLLF